MVCTWSGPKATELHAPGGRHAGRGIHIVWLAGLVRPALALAFAGGVRIGVMASRPSPVLPDRVNQPDQRVNVDIIEPAGREAHYVLLFVLAATRSPPRGEAENPVLFFPVAGHGFTPR